MQGLKTDRLPSLIEVIMCGLVVWVMVNACGF